MGGICPTCGLPEELCMCEEIAREQQEIKIYIVNNVFSVAVITIVEVDEVKEGFGIGGFMVDEITDNELV